MTARLLRVAVTRDEPVDGPLSSALRRRGHCVVHCPVVSTAPATDAKALERAADGLERYDWLIVSSARAVDALMGARPGRGMPAALRTAAVGAQTAARLVSHGAISPIVAEIAGTQDLIEKLTHVGGWRGRRALMPCAAEGSREVSERLRVLGADVDEVVAYRTLARPLEEIAGAWQAGQPVAAIVTSPSAARALAAAVGPVALAAIELIAIGPTTAAALAELGLHARMSAHADFDSAAATLSSIVEVMREEQRP